MSINLGQVLLTAVVTAVVGLLVMESYQTTPWLADKFMRWSVRFRYTDNPERATVRGEELIDLLADLPTLLKLPTAVGFLLRALAYRATHRRNHARREPRAVQYSRGASFRIALVKVVKVILCVGGVFGVEFTILFSSTDGGVDILTSGLPAGILAGISVASEVVTRPSRFRPGFIGGIMCTLSVFSSFFVFGGAFREAMEVASFSTSLLSGTAFGLAAALTDVLTRKFKYAGVIVGALVNLVGMVFAAFGNSFSSWSQPVAFYGVFLSGLGLAVGSMAGFVAAVERRAQGKMPQEDRGA
ncbi:MAG: hypothetical protein ACRDRW_08460 [Pseudonocardiaceae bacterium]